LAINVALPTLHHSLVKSNKKLYNRYMSFVDKVTVTVAAGDGGDGHLSFRHEKFVDKGGPNGGDGGDGGDIVAVASRNQNTLANFRYQKELHAEAGAPGGKQRKHGKNGADLTVPLPVGTLVTNEDGEVIADLIMDGQQVIIANGGSGGFGNAHFVSSTRQAPRVAEKGEKGDGFRATLELKMIADVGLVGLPNAGKSTLLSVISNARPEIADYPFTTLAPNLGVVDVSGTTSLLFADIPGLIEGAAEGKGLGDDFLRHIERTQVVLHLIDVYETDVVAAYLTVQAELKAYKVDLTKRPQIVVLNKTEGLDRTHIADLTKQLRVVVSRGTPIMAISAQAHQGLGTLLQQVHKIVLRKRARSTTALKKDALPVLRLADSADVWNVTKDKRRFVITGPKIERFARRTDFTSDEGMVRLRDIMKRMGIVHELQRQGLKPNDTIAIGTSSFKY
jgi:GTP-binding protein